MDRRKRIQSPIISIELYNVVFTDSKVILVSMENIVSHFIRVDFIHRVSIFTVE